MIRHIYLTDKHPPNVKPPWFGDSIGHYENGDTLVVDTIGLATRSARPPRQPEAVAARLQFHCRFFAKLDVVRAALGIGMGAEWPVGASLTMESWPARSRGLMSGVLQGAFPLGFALASLAYGLLFDVIGWRGLLWLGILPAILCVFIRYYVKEPAVWVENRRRQREQKHEVRAPLLVIFKPALLGNTLSACWWTAGNVIVYYSIYGLFATWLPRRARCARRWRAQLIARNLNRSAHSLLPVNTASQNSAIQAAAASRCLGRGRQPVNSAADWMTGRNRSGSRSRRRSLGRGGFSFRRKRGPAASCFRIAFGL
jgi:MFS family permease